MIIKVVYNREQEIVLRVLLSLFLKIDRYCQTNQPITGTQLEAQNKVSDKQT